MEKLLQGLLKFQEEVFTKKKELFTSLSRQQKPRAVFVTCSDSRIDPTLLTQTEPGDLFIIRNAGNLIPTYGAAIGGSTASLEYGISVLQVKDIIVCGHTDCGAMEALLHQEKLQESSCCQSVASTCGDYGANHERSVCPFAGRGVICRHHTGKCVGSARSS